MDGSGDVKYRLGQVMRTGHFEEIVVNPNWRITWVMMASKKPPGIDMCGPGGMCPYLCVHMTQEKANCLCKDNVPGCVDFAVTASPKRTSTTKIPASLKAEYLWVAGLLLVLVPIFGALTYFLCVHYYEEQERQAELNPNETSESKSTSFNNKDSKSMRKGQVKSNARSRQTGKPFGTPSKAKDGTPWNAMVSWIGLGSADMSDSNVGKEVSPQKKKKRIYQQSSQSSPSVPITPQKLLSKKNRKLPRSKYRKELTTSLDKILCDEESEMEKKKKSKSRSKTPKGENKKRARKGARHKH